MLSKQIFFKRFFSTCRTMSCRKKIMATRREGDEKAEALRRKEEEEESLEISIPAEEVETSTCSSVLSVSGK